MIIIYAVKQLCEKLQTTPSTLEKESILRENINDEQFKLIIHFVFNPFILSGVSDKKVNKQVSLSSDRKFQDFNDLLGYISKNNTGTNQIIANIQNYLDSQNPDIRDFLINIITKSLKLGCDIKTINKVYGKRFIPQWEVQQSYSFDKYELSKDEWFSLSEKLNGIRGTFFKGKILSRQGKEIIGLQHIISDISLLKLDDFALDGELRRKNIDNISDNENFRIGTGIINNDDTEKPSIDFTIYDIIPIEEFEEGKSLLNYSDRLEILKGIDQNIKELCLENISIVDMLYSGTDTEQISKYLDKMVKDDKEGLMLNRDVPYKCKRHNGILKIKQFYTVDLKIIAIEEGSGRLKGMLGSFVVDYKGNPLNVGTGISDELRVKFWSIGDQLIGRIIEVKYKDESNDKKTGNKSLQFPVFIMLREEGKEVSYN